MRLALAALAATLCALPARAYGPATNYALHCQGCHLEDGSGLPGKIPPLDAGLAQLVRTPEGRAYLARVPGVANAPLGDADLAELLAWTLHRFAATELATPYTADEIARLRAQPLVEIPRERF
jgi:mono/diheme cytochrome c family protein